MPTKNIVLLLISVKFKQVVILSLIFLIEADFG